MRILALAQALAISLIFHAQSSFAIANGDVEQTLVGKNWCFEDIDDNGTYGSYMIDHGGKGVSVVVGTNEPAQVIHWKLEDDVVTIEHPGVHASSARLSVVSETELSWAWLPPSYGVSKVKVCGSN